MRKIFIHQELNQEEFRVRRGIFRHTPDGDTPIELLIEFDEKQTPFARYPKEFTRKQVEYLVMVDDQLKDRGEDLLTEDEMFYILDPTKLKTPVASNASTAELQRLAGFEVTKNENDITYFDDLAETTDK